MKIVGRGGRLRHAQGGRRRRGGRRRGQILLVQRADSGVWLYPTGWADVGYSPAEVAVKEVVEETGIHCVPERVIAVLDGLRLGFTRIPLYSLVFPCRAVGGELTPTRSSAPTWAGSPRTSCPRPSPGWSGGDVAFAAIRGEPSEVAFDAPREPVWREVAGE